MGKYPAEEFLQSFLDRASKGLKGETAKEAQVIAILDDILKLSENFIRDGQYNTIDESVIWLVVFADASLPEYLLDPEMGRESLPTIYKVSEETIGNEKIQHPAFAGLINEYIKAIYEEKYNSERKRAVRKIIYKHFKDHPEITLLDTENTAREINFLINNGMIPKPEGTWRLYDRFFAVDESLGNNKILIPDVPIEPKPACKISQYNPQPYQPQNYQPPSYQPLSYQSQTYQPPSYQP